VPLFRRKRVPASHSEDAALSFDEAPLVAEKDCPGCSRHYPLVRAFIKRGDVAHAVSFAALHTHDGVREAWIDVILGTFGDDAATDHLTFGCRVGPVVGEDEPAATAVDAAQPYGDGSIWGRKLKREEALRHHRVPEFWDVVDYVLLADPVVHHHVYGHEPNNV